MRTSKRASKADGFTLIELLIVVAITVLVLYKATGVFKSSISARNTGESIAEVEGRVSGALNKIGWELTGCSVNSISPTIVAPVSSPTLEYQRALDFVAGAIVWGALNSFELRPDVGEVDDGVDNDGDGLVDEGQLIWVQNKSLADETEVVLARNVRRLLEGELNNGVDDNGNGLIDEAGVSFDLSGEILTVRISIEQFGSDRLLITRTSETKVKLRVPSS